MLYCVSLTLQGSVKVWPIMASMSSSSPILSPLQKLDKISQLPDDILLKFLSEFDLKNAVQTSMVAKRWRYLWTWLTELDFDPAHLSPDNCCWSPLLYEKVGRQGYLNWVNQVVDAHCGPYISKFKVCFLSPLWNSDKTQIDKWARFAFSKRVEELDLLLERGLGSFKSSMFSLDFDILKHPPCNNGIVYLKSLCLASVDVSGEALEFILLQCHLLERLYVKDSHTLHTLNIVSYKLKYLTLIGCIYLEKLEIDAVNLICFHFKDDDRCVRTHMVFKSVPKLVEVGFAGEVCVPPFPIVEQISYLSKQLTKLSFCPTIDIYECSDTPVEIHMLFPNVKQLTLTISFLYSESIMIIKFFIDACPMLHELELQVGWHPPKFEEEAKQLQEIDLEDERNGEASIDRNSYSEAPKENVASYVEHKEYENNKSRPNLKVMEIVGFHGCDTEVKCALDIIACANSFETLIWDPRDLNDIGTSWEYEDVERTDTIKRRARKLAKLLPPKAHVGVRDKSGLLWVS